MMKKQPIPCDFCMFSISVWLDCVLNMKALVFAFNQKKALEATYSMITNLRVDLRLKLCLSLGRVVEGGHEDIVGYQNADTDQGDSHRKQVHPLEEGVIAGARACARVVLGQHVCDVAEHDEHGREDAAADDGAHNADQDENSVQLVRKLEQLEQTDRFCFLIFLFVRVFLLNKLEKAVLKACC